MTTWIPSASQTSLEDRESTASRVRPDNPKVSASRIYHEDLPKHASRRKMLPAEQRASLATYATRNQTASRREHDDQKSDASRGSSETPLPGCEPNLAWGPRQRCEPELNRGPMERCEPVGKVRTIRALRAWKVLTPDGRVRAAHWLEDRKETAHRHCWSALLPALACRATPAASPGQAVRLADYQSARLPDRRPPARHGWAERIGRRWGDGIRA